MEPMVEPYFSDNLRRAIFEHASTRIKTVIDGLREDEDEKNRYLLNFIGATFHHIKSYPDLFDERCPENIKNMGDRYVEGANHLVLSDVSDVEYMFSTSYRFLIEYQLGSTDALSGDLLGLIARIYDYEYNGSTFSQLKYAEHQMLIDITKRYIHHPNMTALKALPAQLEQVDLERKRIVKDIGEREIRVNALKDKLDTYKNAFNFFGLYDGFSKLRAAKGTEGIIGLSVLIFLALLMVLPFIVKFYIAFTPGARPELDTQFYLAIIGFEVVMAYFFRVALQNYKSVKAQLIQIDLRMTLCQFVQDYAVYAKEVSKDSPQLLDRFDQIVFSGIVNDEGAIPSTFDGLEHLANLISKVKK
ncbi:hypothetical protein ACTJK3_18840 [Pseudomonas sp. 22105]|uniref:hypothetical protein n=1 Tax=unclassified Pseudomonas TaxID=196821 RepID=UPI003F854392